MCCRLEACIVDLECVGTSGELFMSTEEPGSGQAGGHTSALHPKEIYSLTDVLYSKDRVLKTQWLPQQKVSLLLLMTN